MIIIYEFSTLCKSEDKIAVKMIEAEEKPKTYVSISPRQIIKKADIDKLQSGYGDKMYRLSGDPKPYIQAMVERKRRIMERATENLKRATADFNKWFEAGGFDGKEK